MQVEFHQLELSYQALRCHDTKGQARLVASLCEHGQQSPVMVVEQSGALRRYVLIDGYRRVAALQRLGRDTVEALVLPLSEVEALCLRHQLEGAKRRSALEQGWLLSELVERHGVTRVKLGQLLGHCTSWVSRRLALVHELPERAQELVRTGQLCPYGAMRHLVPLARTKRSHCVRLVERLGEVHTAISERQLGRLCLAWRSANTAERQRIVQQPLLYLRVEDAASGPAAESPSPERLLRNDLDALLAIARRASGRLDDDRQLAGRLPLVLGQRWRQTQLALDELTERMEGRLHAGSGHAHGDHRAQEQGARHQGDRQGALDLQKLSPTRPA